MDEGNTVEFDEIDSPNPWFVTEAAGFMGATARKGHLMMRVADRMRRRARPEQLISGSIIGLFRHGALAAIYLSLAYAAKVLLGISITFNHAMF